MRASLTNVISEFQVADSAETYHIVLPVRPALNSQFDEEISPNKPEAIFCCCDLCGCDKVHTEGAHGS